MNVAAWLLPVVLLFARQEGEPAPLPTHADSTVSVDVDEEHALPPIPRARSLPPTESFPQPLPDTPLGQPLPDPDATALAMMNGGMGICRAASLPLRLLLPSVGTALALAVEWLCLPPVVLGVDYVHRLHGERRGRLWEAALATAVAKVWRDFTDLPVVLNFVVLVTGVSGVTLVAAALATFGVLVRGSQVSGRADQAELALQWVLGVAPLLLTGAVTYSAWVFLGLGLLKNFVSDLLFDKIYALASSRWGSAGEQWSTQRDSWLRPSLQIPERFFLLAALGLGTTAAFSVWSLLPVVGPYVRALHRYRALRVAVRAVAADDFREPKRDLERVEFVMASMLALEAFVGSLAQVALILNGGLLVGGVVMAWFATRPEAARFELLPYTLAVNTALATAATVALFLLVLREAPMALTPVLVPLAYGLLPDEGLLPARE